MNREGRCVCGMLVALHFTPNNRKMSCEETARIYGNNAPVSRYLSIFERQLRAILKRQPVVLKHAACGTALARKREGVYECPSCKMPVILGCVAGHAQPGTDTRRAGHKPTLEHLDNGSGVLFMHSEGYADD